jgi:hypothetical protein
VATIEANIENSLLVFPSFIEKHQNSLGMKAEDGQWEITNNDHGS